MSQTIVHDSFTIERTLSASPARVFEAFSRSEVKAKWFGGPQWTVKERTMDFRVGGREHQLGVHESSVTSAFDAFYLDIVPNERIVYAYEMTVNGRKISTSLATIAFTASGDETRLVITEQGAYYDDAEVNKWSPRGQNASRREGTNIIIDQLVALFAS